MNLKEVAKAQGTNIKKVSEICGVPASTLYSISRGDTNLENVGVVHFMKISRALGMTVEELFGIMNSDLPVEVESSDELTDEEMDLLDYYRALDDAKKNEVRDFARMHYAMAIYEFPSI